LGSTEKGAPISSGSTGEEKETLRPAVEEASRSLAPVAEKRGSRRRGDEKRIRRNGGDTARRKRTAAAWGLVIWGTGPRRWCQTR
jgi:hypothetical protein